MSFVRQSKFRHIFGTEAKKENIYEGFRCTNCAFEGYFIAANKKYIAVCIEVGGGGAFIVLKQSEKGRLPPDQPKVSAHREYVLDLQWNPFNDNMLASCSEDGSIKIWEFENGLYSNIDDSKALLTLDYHERRCIQVNWHPIASNVLMSVSQEPKICIWNLDDGVAEIEIDNHPDTIFNASWSMKGDKIVTSCKDKCFRIFDARSGDLLHKTNGHEGSKPQRVIFVMNDNFLFSCGFTRKSERQYAVWSVSESGISEKAMDEIDTANGCIVPYYDSSSNVVYVAAKGDSAIRYYELTDTEPYIYYLTTFTSKDGQRGLCVLPKRSLDVNICEIMRFYKLVSTKTGYVVPLTFKVPRKSELFQEDLYPPAVSDEPAIDSIEWLAGKDAEPNYIDMKTFFVGKTSNKSASSGGLKKGGLKGLKARKEAKEAKKSEPPSAVKETPPEQKVAEKSASPMPVRSSASSTPSSASSSASAGVDPKVLKTLQDEIKSLKENEKKMAKDIKSLTDKLKEYEKLPSDVKLLCDAVKKNDGRIVALEELVQEESDDEKE